MIATNMTRQLMSATRIHPNPIDGSHIQCHRCGIIRTRPAKKRRNTTDYWCKDCTPYRSTTRRKTTA